MTESLFFQELMNDERIHKAKNLLLEAVADHQRSLTTIKPSNPALKEHYQDLLAQYSDLRGGKLFFPYLGSGFGNGVLVELLDGSVKYDFISGIGVHYWGHSHPEIIHAHIEAALCDTTMQGNLQQNGDSCELVRILLKASGFDHCFLTSSGAMANENALKIIFQKKFPATRLLAFDHCFAGRTLTFSQVTDKPNFREGLPHNLFVDYIPFYDESRPEESHRQSILALKNHLTRYPKQHAGMIFELIQGEGGFYPGTREFFQELMSILKEHHITVFVDEIQTFGRTSALFAYQHFGLEEYVDVVTIGKLSQVCATLFTKEYTPRPGLLSQTFTSSTSAIRAGKVIIDHLLKGGFFGPEGKIMQTHRHFVQSLQSIQKKHPGLIKGPYGLGSMIAFTVYEGNYPQATRFIHELFEAGVISFIAGSHPTRVRFLIPVGAITPNDIDTAMQIVEKTLIKCR